VSDKSGGIIMFTSDIPLRVYKVNLCKSKKTHFTLQKAIVKRLWWQAMVHTLNGDTCNSFECYSPQMSIEYS